MFTRCCTHLTSFLPETWHDSYHTPILLLVRWRLTEETSPESLSAGQGELDSHPACSSHRGAALVWGKEGRPLRDPLPRAPWCSHVPETMSGDASAGEVPGYPCGPGSPGACRVGEAWGPWNRRSEELFSPAAGAWAWAARGAERAHGGPVLGRLHQWVHVVCSWCEPPCVCTTPTRVTAPCGGGASAHHCVCVFMSTCVSLCATCWAFA